MPSFTTFTLLALSAVGTLARPAKRDQCMTEAQANQVAALYGQLIATYTNETADAILAPGFTDYSESVNSLIDECPQGDAAKYLPLLDPTFTSRTQFEIGQGQQPAINFQQLELWQACNSVIIRWQTTNTAPIDNPKPVNGLIVMDTVPAPPGNAYPYQINTVYSEFDSAAWLQNLKDAGICAAASATASASASSTAVTPTPVVSTSAPASATITSAPVVQTTVDGSVVWVTETDVSYETDMVYATTTIYN